MGFGEDRTATDRKQKYYTKMQVLGDIIISSCSSILTGEADKKKI